MEVAQANTGISHSGIRDLKKGIMSEEKFAEIYDAYYSRVYKYICYRINNHYDAEEICSHVFEAVISKYNSYSPQKSNFEVWLFAIARNAVTDYFRSQKKKDHLFAGFNSGHDFTKAISGRNCHPRRQQRNLVQGSGKAK